MPMYAFRCEGEGHEDKAPFEWEGFLQSYSSKNPPCEVCKQPVERVWRGRQFHGELSGFPMTTKMLDGTPRTYNTRSEWETAVKAKGMRIRDDASWLDEDLGTPKYNFRTGRTEYPDRHTVMGGRGTWV